MYPDWLNLFEIRCLLLKMSNFSSKIEMLIPKILFEYRGLAVVIIAKFSLKILILNFLFEIFIIS